MATVPVMIYPLAIVTTWLVLEFSFNNKGIGLSGILHLSAALTATVLLTLIWYLPALLTGGGSTLVNSGLADRNTLDWLNNLVFLAQEMLTRLSGKLPVWATIMLMLSLLTGLFKRPRLVLSTLILPPMFFIQNVVPPARTMLFLAVIYLVIASEGLNSGFKFTTRRFTERGKLVFSGIIAVLIAALQSYALTTRNVPPNLDITYKFPEADEVLEFLDGKISPGTPVLTGVPSDNPLIYYGLRRDIKRMSFLSLGMVDEKFDSLWVITNQRDNYCSLSSLIESNGLDTLYKQQPKLIKSDSLISIYLFSESRSKQ
jgi:hypothetical protein